MTRRNFLVRTAAATGSAAWFANADMLARAGAAEASADPLGDLSKLAGSHDLRLPLWGPYTKTYNGISHIADLERGLRFDLSVFPGYNRRSATVPNVNWESAFHPWEAATDLSYFSYRYELEWKDRVYCDVSFTRLSDRARLVRSELVNRTQAHQNLMVHFMASINYPYGRLVTGVPAQKTLVTLPPGAVWIDALDYQELVFARPRPTDGLVPGGRRRAEVRDHGFVSGSGIGAGFGRMEGDRVRFRVRLPQGLSRAGLLLRYRNNSDRPSVIEYSGFLRGELTLLPGRGFQTATLAAGAVSAGEHELQLVARKGLGFELDGFAILESSRAAEIAFKPAEFHWRPQILPGPVENSRLLKYTDCRQHYGVAWSFSGMLREIHNSELDRFFRHRVRSQGARAVSVMQGDGQGHFTNVFMRPIPVSPGGSQIVYGIAAEGGAEEVSDELKRIMAPTGELERAYQTARRGAVRLSSLAAGEPYRFSQERMAATTLTNLSFPLRIKRRYVRHWAPGKWWDSLYTWDAGFLGIGLAQLTPPAAVDCLNAYVTEPGDPENAFIQAGTPVPVQHYLFLELWNLTQSRSLLEHFYPRLRQYHLFLAGRLGSSTTRGLKSGLLKTWDYFYNTGWDDYPPQLHMHDQKIASRTAGAMMNSQLIRTARILAQVARLLGRMEDIADYEADIAIWSEALLKHSWDPDAGYFSFVVHDEQGKARSILRDQTGRNLNMGLDGVMPLLAGICTPDQVRALLGHLQSPKRLWTPIGLSTIDQSAPYYERDGYWNGGVWMPHQWFLWKAMLDLGEADFAFKIAQTALEVWKAEVEESYHCFEHFRVETERGAGWHQFTSLNSPVLAWFAAYYRPGRLTAGFDTWIHRVECAGDFRSLSAELELLGQPARQSTVLVTLPPGTKYQVEWQGRTVRAEPAACGTLQIQLPSDAGRGRLRVGLAG